MAKVKKTLWAAVVLFLIMATTPAFSEEEPIIKLFFKSGTVMQCDQVWEGVESNVLCKKSRGILAYSTDEIDLVKTFGETDGKEIAARYERIKKERELSSKPIIITPEQARAMSKRQSERSKIDNPARLTRKEVEKMFSDLITEGEARSRGVAGGVYTREDAIANYLRWQAKHDYEQAGSKSLERIRLERTEKGKKPKHNTGAVGTRDGTFYAPTGNGGFINTRTGEVLAPSGNGGAVGTRDGTFYAPTGGGGLVNTRTGEPIN